MTHDSADGPHLPRALATFVRRGVYTLNVADARLVGITSSQVNRWKKRGFLRSLGGGAYVIQAPLVAAGERQAITEEHLRRARSVIDAIDGTHLTGRTAVLAHGLPVYSQPQEVEFTRRPWSPTRREDLRSRRPWGTTAAILVDGLRVQPLAEAVIEVAGREGSLAGLVSADAALHRGDVTSDDLVAAATIYGSRVGAADARLVARLADGRIESPAESTCGWTLHFAGIPVTPQVSMRNEEGFVGRVDFLVEGSYVIVEVDGLEKYVDPDELSRQALRQARLEALGYVVIRVTTVDLHSIHHVVERVRRALREEKAMRERRA